MGGLLQWDERLLLAINGAHAPWLDGIMITLSNRWVWIPMYLALAGMIYWKRGGGELLLALLLAVPVILLADQVASGLLKPLVARPRPCHEAHLEAVLVNITGKCGGPFGFVSSHAANFFALCVYVGTLMWRESRWIFWTLLAVAVAVSYSRVYLGVHYPTDVLAGAVLGSVSGMLGSRAFRWASVQFLRSKPMPSDQNGGKT